MEDFWNTDTYTTYTLLDWELKAIEREEKELADLKKGNNTQRSGNRYEVEDDPASVNLYEKATGRELDED
ncbi:hypothetical protein DSECCO2_631660 [anaerobic digester metagenome]